MRVSGTRLCERARTRCGRPRWRTRALRTSGGLFITVSEEEIKTALLSLCRQGFYIEPTSAAVSAGAARYCAEQAAAGEVIVSVFSGHGLKTTEKMLKLAGL